MRIGSRAWAWLLLLAPVAIQVTGCHTGTTAPAPPARPFRGLTITVAVLGDPAILTTVAALRGEWTATRAAEVVIRQSPVAPRSLQGADLVVFPGDRLGELVDAQALAALPESLVAPPVAKEPDTEARTSSGFESRDGGSSTVGDTLQFGAIAP